jgi:hypothetical protein
MPAKKTKRWTPSGVNQLILEAGFGPFLLELGYGLLSNGLLSIFVKAIKSFATRFKR